MADKTSNVKKATVASGVAAAVLVAGLGGAGLHALFTDTQDTGRASEFTSGVLRLGSFKSGVAKADYDVTVGNLAAGDTTYRFFNVLNDDRGDEKSTLDVGRLEARVVTEGELSDAGKSVTQTTQVNGDTAVGQGQTPLQMKITACMRGEWTLIADGTNPDGSRKYDPTCSGTAVEVMPAMTGSTAAEVDMKAQLRAQPKSDGVDNFVPMNYFAGDTSARDLSDTSVKGKNVVLYNVRSEGSDGADGSATNDKARDDGMAKIGETLSTLKPGESISYMITYHLPKNAKNEYQGTSAKTKLWVTATQRDSSVGDVGIN